MPGIIQPTPPPQPAHSLSCQQSSQQFTAHHHPSTPPTGLPSHTWGGRQANCIKRLLQSARLLVAHHQSKTLKVSHTHTHKHTHSHANTHGSANKSHTNARASRKACTGCHRRVCACVLHLESAPNAFQCTPGNLCARTAPQKHAQMNGLAALVAHTFICVYVLLKPIACSPRSNAEQTHISFRCVCGALCSRRKYKCSKYCEDLPIN